MQVFLIKWNLFWFINVSNLRFFCFHSIDYIPEKYLKSKWPLSRIDFLLWFPIHIIFYFYFRIKLFSIFISNIKAGDNFTQMLAVGPYRAPSENSRTAIKVHRCNWNIEINIYEKKFINDLQFDISSSVLIWLDLIWFDLVWYDMIWFDMIWFDLWYKGVTLFHLILIIISSISVKWIPFTSNLIRSDQIRSWQVILLYAIWVEWSE